VEIRDQDLTQDRVEREPGEQIVEDGVSRRLVEAFQRGSKLFARRFGIGCRRRLREAFGREHQTRGLGGGDASREMGLHAAHTRFVVVSVQTEPAVGPLRAE
jgi:hypothetical protein